MKKNKKIIILKKEKRPPLYARILIKISLAVTAILIAFSIMFLIGQLTPQITGSDSAVSAAVNILTAIDGNDGNAIKNLMYFKQNDYDNTVKNLISHAELYKDNMTLDTDLTTNQFTEHEWNIDSARSETKVSNANAAKRIEAKISITKTSNNNTYHSTGVYSINTFCLNDRWYVYSIIELYEMINDATSEKEPGDTIGNDTLGYLSAMSGWQLNSETDDRISVKSETGMLTISVSDLEDSIDTILNDVIKDKEYKELTDCDISGLSGKRLFLYDPENNIQTYLWIFKQPLKDDYIHYVELKTTDAYKDYSIINNYSF